MLVSYFIDAYQKTPEKNLELDEILADIKTGEHKTQIDNLRKLKDELAITNNKLHLPNFMASGVFAKSTNDSLLEHSGYIQVDFDNKKDHPDIQKAGFTKESLRKKLIADNYIYALFDSPTNTGLKAIVKIPTIAHRQSFQALEKYFKDNYNNLQIDTSCKNEARRFFVSYDKDLFLNKNSDIFSEIALEEKELKEFSKEIDKDLFRDALNHIPGKSKDDGKRSYYLNIIWACKTVLGESEAYSIGEKLLSSSDMIKDLPSIIRTGKTIDHPQLVFKEAISAGWIYPKKKKSKVANLQDYKDNKNKPTEGNLAVNNAPNPQTNFTEGNSNYSKIRQWLASRHSFRYNVLTDVVYFKEAEKWNPVNDRIVNNFLQDMDTAGIEASDNRVNTILNSRFSKEYDAIKDYFDSLDVSTIDAINTHYLEDFFFTITGKTKHEKPNEFETMKTWFCSHAGISLGEIEKVDQLYCLCFQGKQATGKTSLFRYLTPNVLKEYVKENLTDYENKDTKISLGENFLILLDELGESSKHDLIKLKSLITQKAIKERRPHAKRDSVLMRRAGFVGTFDKEQVFDDSAGNRRFIVIEIQKIEWSKLKEIPIDEIWKEAKFYYSLGNYNKSIDGLNTENNSKYEKTNPALEAIDNLYFTLDKNGNEFYTATEMQSHIEKEMRIRLSPKSIGEAMNKLGFEKVSKAIDGISLKRYKITAKATKTEIAESKK
jgi:predicted P-loop ATPase